MLKILKIVRFRNKAFYGTTLKGLMKIKTKFSSMIGYPLSLIWGQTLDSVMGHLTGHACVSGQHT